jgi:hypothetical protein
LLLFFKSRCYFYIINKYKLKFFYKKINKKKRKKKKHTRIFVFMYHASITGVPHEYQLQQKNRYAVNTYPMSTIRVPVSGTYPISILSLSNGVPCFIVFHPKKVKLYKARSCFVNTIQLTTIKMLLHRILSFSNYPLFCTF